jgi:hypothetical protein|tara:strand:+ start:31 stop:459 length:429 start_codon:yes stop_codon:yes gene_type:complete
VKPIKQLELFKNILFNIKNKNNKLCTKCNLIKPLESFPWRSGEQVFRREHCRECVKRLSRERKVLKDKHGMPSENYICPLCLGTEVEVAKRGGKHAGSWVLDHSHQTGEFRGWLCHLCNRALGCFKDDSEILKRAIKYLKGE